MSTKAYYDNIQKYLLLYVANLQHSNGVGLADGAIHAENLFAEILNTVYDWKLENANELRVNHSSFDLVDLENQVCVQVATGKDGHKGKYEHTLKSFGSLVPKVAVKQFIVLFASTNVDAVLLKKRNVDGVIFEGYDVTKLLKKILYRCRSNSKLKLIMDCLQHAVMPESIHEFSNVNLSSSLLPYQKKIQTPQGLYIKREMVIQGLFDFVQGGSGLLIGGPGFGKSFTIEELKRFCESKGLPCYVLRINDLAEGNDSEIAAELKLANYWLTIFQEPVVKYGMEKPVFIFDAFDTAKDERLKANILRQIRRVLDAATGKWGILVSVRSYDATKSRNLLELFPVNDLSKIISCRNFEIPELTDLEVEAALDSVSELRAVAEKCTSHLRHLFRTPYFLKLFEGIIMHAVQSEPVNYNSIETEEQLLAVYWQVKISDATNKDLLLQKITGLLADHEHLSCDKAEILTEANSQVYDQLISLGILEEVSVSRQKVAFSHNILLDFAISKYLLKDDISEQVRYIYGHEKLPFIFRQSFIYFYTRLYKAELNLFWLHYHRIFREDSPLFRLLHQTTVNYVLISFYSRITDLQPIFEEKDKDKRGLIVKRLLEGVRFICKGKFTKKEVDLFLYLSGILHWIPLWEIGFLLEKAIAQFADDKVSMKKLSQASCNCLEFVLEERKSFSHKPLLDRNGGVRGIDNVCKTMGFNPLRTKKLINQILPILDEEDFPIDFFAGLAEHIVTIYGFDATLGAKIYSRLYAHHELSDKETHLGPSVVMTLKSNRAQDYRMIHYVLEQAFASLLLIDFSPMMKIGLDILDQCSDYRRYKYRIKERLTLNLGSVSAKIYDDYSFLSSEPDEGFSSHLFRILEVIENNLKSTNTRKEGIAQINLMLPKIQVSSIWGEVLKLLVKYPTSLKNLRFSILCNTPIYAFDDTVYQAGELIKITWPELSESNKVKIELAIHGLSDLNNSGNRDEYTVRIINRLLNCVPEGEVILPQSKSLLASSEPLKNIPVNKSGIVSVTRGGHSSAEERMLRYGFDPEDANDLLHYSWFEKFEVFNNLHEDQDNQVAIADCLSLLPFLEALYVESQHWNKERHSYADYQITRFVKIFSSLGTQLDSKQYDLAKRICLYYINDERYKDTVYEPGDLKSGHRGFSPTPRTVSVQTLLNLVHTSNEADLEDLLETLTADNTQSVRMKAAHGIGYFWKRDKERFWKKTYERAFREFDSSCLQTLVRNIYYTDILHSDTGFAEAFIDILLKKIQVSNQEVSRELNQIIVKVLLKLIIFEGSTASRTILTENLGLKELCRTMVFEIMTVIDPHDKENDYSVEPDKYQVLVDIIMEILAVKLDSILSNGMDWGKVRSDFEIIDHVIQHLYFTTVGGRKKNKGNFVEDANKRAFYLKTIPILNFIVEQSKKIETGFMVAHTGYYFMRLLNYLLEFDVAHILCLSNAVVSCSAKNGFTYDNSTLKEIVKLTEHIFADHKEILYKKENFNNLIVVLDQFSNSGWQDAMELTWRLKEAF